jgi:hypothetical protein
VKQASSLTQTDSTKDFNNFALNSSNLNNTGLLGLNRLSTPDSSKKFNVDNTNTNTQQNFGTMGLQNTLNPQSGLQKDNVSHSNNAAQLNTLLASLPPFGMGAPWFSPLGTNLPLNLNTNTYTNANTNTPINSTNNTTLSMVNDQNKGFWPQSLPPFGSRSEIAKQAIDLKTESFKNSDLNNSLAPLQNVPRNQYSLFLALADSLQEKTLELAIRYNNHSIESITNFFADFISLITLLYLLVSLEIQINITKSFLLEVFFGLDDSKKSLLILIMTDLLVGYHSSNLWELFFQFIFNHYGIPESQTGIFLLVATLPVLLDVLFKYLIFRHLNRSSPATVATYHAIIE